MNKKRFALALLGSFGMIGAVQATPLVPDAAYVNGVQATYAYTFPGEVPLGDQSTTSPTTGLIVNGSYPPREFWTATTYNNYSIPNLRAAARVTGDVKATAMSALVYSVEFVGAGSTVGVNVTAYGDADVFANGPVDEGFHDFSANGASALLYIMQPDTFSTLFSIVANSDLSKLQGSHSFSLDQIYNFKTNTVYRVFMDASVSVDYGHSAVAEVDPYFGVPDGYTLFISDGIGNAPSNATPVPEPGTGNGNGNGNTVPEPASLYLLGIGVAGLGITRRRKQYVNPSDYLATVS